MDEDYFFNKRFNITEEDINTINNLIYQDHNCGTAQKKKK